MFVGTLYYFAAIAAIGVLASLTGFDLANAVGTWPIYFLAPFMLIGAFFTIGGMLFSLGMILDCAFVVKLPIWLKAIWLVLLVLTGGVVAYVYYFRVYKNRPSVTFSAELKPPAQS